MVNCMGVFHGVLNPLSSKSIVECCVMPVLMYGSESWVLNSSLLSKLESFQSELRKRISKYSITTNNIPLLALRWPSMCARLLCNKLSFLHHICNGQSTSLSTQVFRSLAASDSSSISLVRQSQFLDQTLGTEFTKEVLTNKKSIEGLKKRILKANRLRTLGNAMDHI